MTHTQKMVTSSVFIACGIILPMAFHFTGLPGQVFLPMHIPVLTAGMFLGGKAGLAVGVLTPILSSITTGMPSFIPTLPRMTVELGMYGLVGGYFYKTRKVHLFISLLAAMIVGRLASFVMGYLLITVLNLKIDPIIYISASTVSAIPGIVIQFILIPLIVKKLETILRRKPSLE